MSARQHVIAHLEHQVRRFPDLEIGPPSYGDLDDRDRAFAAALDHAVVRHWLTLRCLTEPHLSRPWPKVDAHLRACLLAGAAQLLFLDGVPDHAAISESVEVAKRGPARRGAGLVNAVLRRVARARGDLIDDVDLTRRDIVPRPDGRAWVVGSESFPDDTIERIAAQTSHPRALLSRWSSTLGFEPAVGVALHDLVVPPLILTGLGPAAPDAALRRHQQAGFFVLDGEGGSLRRVLDADPGARVQDPTTARAVAAARDLAPEVILDACAGRGTKTRQLAELHPRSRVVATDVNENRRAALRAAFPPGGHVEIAEPGDLAKLHGQVDLLVLDVPCSNSGVLARRVEARYRCDRRRLDQLVTRQRQIIADTFTLLSPKGRILYATCSIDPAENEAQARHVATLHRLEIEASEATLPAGRPGEDAARYHDGGYWAMLARG